MRAVLTALLVSPVLRVCAYGQPAPSVEVLRDLAPTGKQDGLEVAAGVRQQLEAYARGRTDVRIMAGRFQEIQQAMATPKGGWPARPTCAPSRRT